MLQLAREHNRRGDRVSYVHNTRADLACFTDGSFDFVCSVITLQHIPPEFSRRYIAEFLRVLAPGGAALFQVPFQAPPQVPEERIKFSTWPPTLLKRIVRVFGRRLARFVRHWFGREPQMEMYTLPRDEVVAIVRSAGGEVLDVQPHGGGGNAYASYAYLVRKC
jgi:ubiquinone/menaquinone biosynthesis C-methylase UbiE